MVKQKSSVEKSKAMEKVFEEYNSDKVVDLKKLLNATTLEIVLKLMIVWIDSKFANKEEIYRLEKKQMIDFLM